MATVHSYLRFSSKKQAHGDSKRRQTQRSDEWIGRNKHVLSPLHFEDLGVSAFRGKNRHTGGLKRFLQAIEEGHVRPGEILLVENLDRLSREGVAEAFSLFTDILRAGVSIAVLTPTERIYTKKSINDLVGLIEPLMSFHLGWEESAKKSDRVGKVWQQKRKKAQETGQPLNRKCPAWLTWNEERGRFDKKPEAAKSIKYIFQRTVDGIGQRTLMKELTEKFKPVGLSGHWNSSYVQKVLSDRAVLGELQMKSFDADGNRIPQGKPVADYYPRVVDDGLWYRAQSAKASRVRHKGPNSDFFSLFSGMVVNARDGHQCHIQTTASYNKLYRRRRLVSYGHLRNVKGACSLSFDYPLFESAVLAFLGELKPADVNPTVTIADDSVGDKESELRGVEGRLTELRRQLENPETNFQTIIDAVGKLENKRTALRRQIQILKQEQATSEDNPIAQTQTLLELLQASDNERKREIRTKLRVLIPNVIESIYVVPVKRPKNRIFTWVQVNLKSGGFKQIFITQKHVAAITELDAVNVDLRNPAHVARLVKETERAVA